MATKSQQYTGRLYTQAEVDRMLREARIANTYSMMTEYTDWCNVHSTELDDGAGNFTTVKPTFLGFKRFVDDKLTELSKEDV